MRIVKFNNGKYGIRLFYFWYFDLTRTGIFKWRTRSSCFFNDCQGTAEEVKNQVNILTDKGCEI